MFRCDVESGWIVENVINIKQTFEKKGGNNTPVSYALFEANIQAQWF